MRKKSSSNNARPQSKGKNVSSPNQRGRQAKSPASKDPLAFLSTASGSRSKKGRKILFSPSPIASDASPVSSPEDPKLRKKSALNNAKPQKKGKKGSPLLNHLSPPNLRGRQVRSPSAMDTRAFFSSVSGTGLKKGRKVLSSPSPIALDSSPVPSPKKNASTIVDLKNHVASRIDSLKRHFDRCHSDVMKEFDASQARISKRFKTQTQACLHLTEDIDKEYKKLSDRIVENTEHIKGSYKDFIEEAQSAARSCKVSFSELAKSTEKALTDLRARYKVPTAHI